MALPTQAGNIWLGTNGLEKILSLEGEPPAGRKLKQEERTSCAVAVTRRSVRE